MKRLFAALLLLVLTCSCSPRVTCEDMPTPPPAGSPSPLPSPVLAASPTQESPPSEPPVPEETSPYIAGYADGYYGALRVEGASLVDRTGKAVQLRGVSSHGLSWFPEYVNEDALSELRDLGCNVFRLAMYTAEYNGYCVGDEENREALKVLIDDAVTWTAELEMYIIIDWHILIDGSPLVYKDQALEFFAETAERYADAEHVIYEICNEPNGGTTWQDVKSYAEEVIPVIREHTDAVILVGSPTWSQDIHLAAESPLEFDNIMYTLHFYAATHGDDLRERMLTAFDSGLPAFVSEYGICDASGNGAIDENAAGLWLETMDSRGISHVMWSLSNKDESSAMLLPSCTKTSGFTREDLSRAGRWFCDYIGEA